MLLYLYNKVTPIGTFHYKGIMNPWQNFFCFHALGIKMDIYDRPDNLGYVSGNLWHNIIV